MPHTERRIHATDSVAFCIVLGIYATVYVTGFVTGFVTERVTGNKGNCKMTDRWTGNNGMASQMNAR